MTFCVWVNLKPNRLFLESFPRKLSEFPCYSLSMATSTSTGWAATHSLFAGPPWPASGPVIRTSLVRVLAERYLLHTKCTGIIYKARLARPQHDNCCAPKTEKTRPCLETSISLHPSLPPVHPLAVQVDRCFGIICSLMLTLVLSSFFFIYCISVWYAPGNNR